MLPSSPHTMDEQHAKHPLNDIRPALSPLNKILGGENSLPAPDDRPPNIETEKSKKWDDDSQFFMTGVQDNSQDLNSALENKHQFQSLENNRVREEHRIWMNERRIRMKENDKLMLTARGPPSQYEPPAPFDLWLTQPSHLQ
ncbi:uncharacterized protein LOC119735748 [Patiria miniata]|uniref:Uncharacterized protein n=1 Tax=Patiria miniata TaxID=46514 RepID=A0A914APP5_PATMI|nr:uncharacterized protein LOC119735748 [Patiria miniata]